MWTIMVFKKKIINFFLSLISKKKRGNSKKNQHFWINFVIVDKNIYKYIILIALIKLIIKI
jgi:uncharacterized membrane protein